MRKFLVLPISILFEKILDEECIPARAKISVVIPIHKGGSRAQTTNNRPISLLSPIMKIIEFLLLEQMKAFTDKYGCIAKSHFGGHYA